MRQREHQSGFGTIEILLVILVIAALTIVGVVAYRHHTKPSNAKNSAATSPSQTTAQPAQAAKPDLVSGYLVIKEWGIKVKLEDADKVTYTIGGNPNGSAGNADSIVSWATLQLNNSVSASDKCKSLGFEVDQLIAATNATKIGKYYYGFSGTSTDCGDSSVDSLRSKIVNTELINSAIFAQ